MPISVQIDGMEQISIMLNELEDKAHFVASQALYQGAGEMAKAVNDAAKSIRTEPFKYTKTGHRLPSPEEKQILMENGAMGIAKFENDGAEVNTSVGYNASGYADVSWNHMNSSARTNYKAVTFKGKENTASSTLRFIRRSGKAEQYGMSSSIGHGAQNRKPIGVIANSINSGTSFMTKQPFFRKGVSAGTDRAKAVMIKTVESLFNSIIRQNEGGKSA